MKERFLRVGFITLLLVLVNGFFQLNYANISHMEREALITLYNSTDGDLWIDNSGWKDGDDFTAPGTEGTWYGITLNEGETAVEGINLYGNQLAGSIPPELGSLSNLGWLVLYDNQLTGSIPPELGHLTELWMLNLAFNKLEGSIPPELGNLSSLQGLYLWGNQLTGSIPVELGDLSSLTGGALRLDYNALYTDDEELKAFIEKLHSSWDETQTIAPADVTCAVLSSTSIRVGWTRISYTLDPGGYRVWYSEDSGGPYMLFGTTEDKSVSGMDVTDLDPGTTYYFVVQTRTEPHYHNQNTVDSEYSAETVATTNTIVQDLFEELTQDIEDMGLPAGIETSVTQKLENAMKSLENGSEKAAINKLEAFIHEVEAQRGNKLTDEEADALIAAAQSIIVTINS